MELRRILPTVGAIVVAVLALVLLSTTHAESAQEVTSLLGPGTDLVVVDCAHSFDGSAVVHFPADAFDADPMVHIDVRDEAGWSSGSNDTWAHFSGLVHVRV